MTEFLLLAGSFLIEILLPSLVEIVLEVLVWFFPQGIERADKLPLWMLLGALLGWLSTYVLPYQVIGDTWALALNVMVAPIVCGFLIHMIGNNREKRKKVRFRFENFWGGALFSLGFIICRLFILHLDN
ncbi:MAG: hypothetical protein H6624_04745 [Bdellovibrionaceae bacterium]|nr:hypothetical protein [Bdellovibrionales bacterium]MCB9083626.1 hypothetical protein [Pseudobdellovibrionaceae bacterium]